MDKIHFAVVGCGHIGKRHAEMITRNAQAKLSAMCDIKSAEQLNISHYESLFYNSIDSLLASDLAIDVVNICTPNGLHAEHAIKVLQQNKHVVIEKPMALSAADCDAVINESIKRGKKIFCVMQNRFSPPSVWLKEVVSSGILGKTFIVQINCFWNRDARYYHENTWHGKQHLDGGTLFTQFSHFIDTMLWLFGDIENISSTFADFNHQQLTEFEDSGIVAFNFVNGGIGSINYSSSVYNKNFESSIRIIAENGTIEIGGQYMNEVKYCDIKNYTMPELAPTAAPNNYGPYIGSAANHHFIIDNIIDVLQDKANIATTAYEGKLVVDVIERIYAQRPPALLKK